MDELDALLADFERELDYFERTRDFLGPIMVRLVAALDAFFAADRSPAVREEAAAARRLYVDALSSIESLLADWVRIRGAGQRAVEAEPFMDDVRARWFDALCARELTVAQGREAFDALQRRLPSLLLLYEESTP